MCNRYFGEMKNILSKIVMLIVLVTLLFAKGENRANFFIVENPARFEILDRYQQKVSSSDKTIFGKFTPWKIIEENSVLSDQFTQAMKVELDGKQYFFVRDDQGKLIHSDEDGFSIIIKECILNLESITVAQSKSVLFRKIPFNEKNKKYKRNYLEKGIRLKTIFKKKNDYFVQRLDGLKQYGWIRPSGKRSIKKTSGQQITAEKDFQINDVLMERVRLRVEKVNHVYTKLFNNLNTSYSQNRPAPFWSLDVKGNGLVFQLQNSTASDFKRSIDYFVNEVETVFAGSPFTVHSSATAIEVVSK